MALKEALCFQKMSLGSMDCEVSQHIRDFEVPDSAALALASCWSQEDRRGVFETSSRVFVL